jgi:branched-chain amino acid transport system ATP-binding protein
MSQATGPEQNAWLCMARAFQNTRLFRDLPAIDNVAVGLHMRHGAGFLPTMLRFPSAARSEASIRARSLEVLEILSLRDRADDLVSSLPYGDQGKVEFARALATEPSLLLLDEPSAGMNPHETTNLGTSIASLHRELGLTIILVEHDMKMIMTHCQRILEMHYGRIQTGARRRTCCAIRASSRPISDAVGAGPMLEHEAILAGRREVRPARTDGSNASPLRR